MESCMYDVHGKIDERYLKKLSCKSRMQSEHSIPAPLHPWPSVLQIHGNPYKHTGSSTRIFFYVSLPFIPFQGRNHLCIMSTPASSTRILKMANEPTYAAWWRIGFLPPPVRSSQDCPTPCKNSKKVQNWRLFGIAYQRIKMLRKRWRQIALNAMKHSLISATQDRIARLR